jgi:hypothetical protein
MKTKRNINRVFLLLACLTFVAVIVAAALPQSALAAPKPDDQLTFSARIDQGKLYLTINPYHDKAKFQLKLRNPQAAQKWFSLGPIKIVKNTGQTFVRPLPKALADKFYIQVCLKNQKTDRLNCKSVLNPQS